MKPVLEYLDEQRETFRGRLMELLAVPSISAQSAHNEDIRRAAELVARYLELAGLRAEIISTAGHPVVLADSGPADSGPTVLVYGHYDVQPEGDLSLWHSPPFEPTVRDGTVFARGAADDKGQMLTHIFAVEAWMKAMGKVPTRVKFLIEGEEEVGSKSLDAFVKANAARLACDYVAISDTPQFRAGLPAITYGTRGLVYKEIRVYGPKQNLHSGSFGGTIVNPANALATILARLRDENCRVTIPGFYDDVEEPAMEERARLRALPLDEKAYLEELGSPAAVGENGWTTTERRSVRPTLDVNGLLSGYTGEGSSTIIPSHAMAKVSMRIVPNQDPQRVSELFDAAVRAACPAGVRLEIMNHAAAPAYVAPLDSPGMKAAERAVAAAFGVKPVFMREGGTLPILALFKQVLGADCIMMGFCMPNCNAHGPNEFFHLRDFEAGMRTAAHFLQEVSTGR